jgi:PKD repeat protein
VVWCGVTSKSLRWIVAGVLILCLCSGIATASTRTRILTEATVFIGEQGLDISSAMGGYNRIAYWSPGSYPLTDPPTWDIDVSATKTNFFVDPAKFVGYTGTWYRWEGIPQTPAAAFYIQDPYLVSSIRTRTDLNDVTGKAVMRGTYLTFRLETDMYSVLTDGKRENAGADTDGFLTFTVKDDSGATFTSLYNSALTLQPLGEQAVYNSPGYWGEWQAVPSYWATGAAPGGGYAYTTGTYIVSVKSDLNGMKDNYLDAGADYVGKTVSLPGTVDLLGTPGAITVNSVPPGASITIDNVATGAVTDTTIDVAPGNRAVKVSLSGYSDQQDIVGVDSGATSSVVFTMVPGAGSVTMVYAGDGSYYFGERIRFSGTNYESGTTYLFLKGPGLPAEGAQMVSPDPKNNPVVNGNPSTFGQATVPTDHTWRWDWYTEEDIPIDPGTYTVYASAYPVDYNNLAPGAFTSVNIDLGLPFISASVNRATGPIGTKFTISGTKEGGVSPNYYVYITMTNNTPPILLGGLPTDGVRPDDLLNVSVTGRNETFGLGWVASDASFSYEWDTSALARGSLVPGSVYRFVVMNRPYNIEDAFAIPYPPAPGNYNRATYTKLQLGIEGPVTAGFTSRVISSSSVEFTDTSTGIPTTASFDFGDGAVTSVTPGGTVAHTYATAGIYTVTLTAGNSLGSDTESQDITLLSTTRDQATEAVIESVLKGNPAGKSVYTSLAPVAAGTLVQGWSTSFNPRFTGWLVIIDDNPKANWEHPVRWVQKGDGDQQEITLHTSLPKNVALSRTGGDTPIIGGTNDIGSGYSGGNTGYGGGTASCANIECDTCYALLVSGGFDRDNNFNRYYDDLSAMYRTLRQTYCYPEEHIYVLMSDGPAEGGIDQRTGETTYADSPKDLDGLGRTNDIFGPAGRADLEQMLRSLRGDPLRGDVVAPGIHTLEAGDDLFIFTTNHGGKDPESDRVRLWLWDQEFIWDDEFTALIDGSLARSITMTMEQCYSGGFVDDFMNGAGSQTRVIATAASPTEPSYGNDFSFWWIEGATGPANQLPGGNEDRLISLLEGFGYAVDHDPSAAQHLETPMYSGDAGEGWSISSCSRCPAPVPLPDCAGCLVPTDVPSSTGELDGMYEDLDGNGAFTMEDVELFFARFETIKETEPACAFDTNGNGRLDFSDIVNLYAEVQ